jgi:hypothetical protein
MREIRLSGSEGGGGREASPYPYQSATRYRRASNPGKRGARGRSCRER